MIDNTQTTSFAISGKTIVFNTAPTQNAIIEIYRVTPTERLVSWADASVLRAADMTISQVQQLHIIEEEQDWIQTNSIMLNGTNTAWQGRGKRIENVANPTAAQDVVTRGYMENVQDGFVQINTGLKNETTKQASIAKQQATIAVTAANNAEQDKNTTITAKNLAERWAQAIDSPDGITENKSAKTWALTSGNAASAAEASKNAAKVSEVNAKTSESNAHMSVIEAQRSATQATLASSNAETVLTQAEDEARKAQTAADLATAKATDATNQANRAKSYADTLDTSNLFPFQGATPGANGKQGLVPAPSKAEVGKVLGANGQWITPYSHPVSGVNPGTYTKVTVNNQGHVTGGNNSTLAISEGGTGATTTQQALHNLGIAGAIIGLSVSGRTITYTKKDGSQGSINTQDTSNGIIAASLNENGYIKFANGLILQWGRVNSGSTFTFPIAFSATVYSIVKTPQYNTHGNNYNMGEAASGSPSLTGFTMPSTSPSLTFYVIAIGK